MSAHFRLAAVAGSVAVLFVMPAVAQADDYIVVLKDNANEATESAAHAKQGAKVSHHFKNTLNGYAAELSEQALASVRSDPDVDFVTESRHFRIPQDQRTVGQATSSSVCDPNGSQVPSTGIRRIGGLLSSAISGNCRGSVPPVNVAVIDTGIDPNHADLSVTASASCVPGLTPFEDVDGHGTFIGGVIAAGDNQIGVNGVAPGANLFSVRVTPSRSVAISEAASICALDVVVGTRRDKDRRNDVQIANLSFSGPGADDGRCGKLNDDAFHRAICEATRAGVTVVASAGNAGTDISTRFPASYDEVLTTAGMVDYDGQPGGQVPPLCVGGTVFDGQADDQFDSFSGFATLASDRAHTVAAPGECITSTVPVSQCSTSPPPNAECYDVGDGTSYATAHVSGVVALCIAYEHCKGRSARQIRDKIVGDAASYNLGNPGYGFIGDPLRPVADRYYGWLVRAGIY